MDFKRSDINPAVTHAPKNRATLIVIGGRSEVGIASIDCRTAVQQLMSERGSSIVLERSKHGIGVDLVARAIQKPVSIVAAQIVTG